jgi:O-acetyl-ADP-ribose deacetylase (regulator of RNase III)
MMLLVTSFLNAHVEQVIAFDNALDTVQKLINSENKERPQLIIEVGDITQKSVDAIVNAANKELEGGAGVCGAIFKTAGWKKLQDACNIYPSDAQGIRCPVGQACITDSFELSKQGIKKIIHAVGPDCRIVKNSKEQAQLLRDAYTNSLKLADQYALTSIAFPFISSGIYACPPELATRQALMAIDDYITHNPETSLKQIYILLFDQKSKDLFDTQVRILNLVAS